MQMVYLKDSFEEMLTKDYVLPSVTRFALKLNDILDYLITNQSTKDVNPLITQTMTTCIRPLLLRCNDFSHS